MPDVEPRTSPSREGLTAQKDQADLQAVCSGRRRTSVLLNSPSPCVNSAITHIQEMKRLVGNWSQQPHSGKYQSELNQDKHIYSKTLRFQSRDLDSDSAIFSDLFVEGVGISARESYQTSPLQTKVNDVLMEAVHLIERLEADRQYAEEALQKEKRRRKHLESKVHSISLWKQTEHTTAVQREHEACCRDITELKLQLKLEREKAEQVQEKLSKAEGLNQHLQEDIDIARRQIPIVRENLQIQREQTNQIKADQTKVDEVCSKTRSELLLAQKELNEMKVDAKKKKIELDHGLTKIKNHLAENMDHLNQLKITEEDLVAEIKNAEETINLTEEMCTNIKKRIPEIAELEKIEKDRISQLESKIEEEIQKNIKLTSQQDEIEQKKTIWEAEVSSMEAQLQSKHEAFAAVCKDNLESEQKVDDYKRKTSESEKAVKQMREERKQMLQKITDNDEQWEKAREEVTQVASQHSVTQAKLEEQEQLTYMEEQKTRMEIKNWRENLTNKMTTLETLKAVCAADKEELKNQQKNLEQINQQLQKEFEESSSITKALESKIKNKKKLTENLEKMQREHKETLVSRKKEEKLKHDELKAAQDLHSATIRRYDSTLGRIADLMKEREEYSDASDKMEQNVESMQDLIAELQKDLNGLEFKNKSAALIMSILQSDINNCQQRTQRSMQTHTAHLQARKKQMEDTKEALKKALFENKQLASDYEGLQKPLMEAREESASALSRKNHAHETYNYYKELSLFQKRMHKALVKYLQQRNLCSLAELDRCQALSQETAQKIKTAQEKLSEEIHLVSSFLDSLREGSTASDDSAENKQASSGAAGRTEQKPSAQTAV